MCPDSPTSEPTTNQNGNEDNQQSDIDSALSALVQWMLPDNVVQNVPVGTVSVNCSECKTSTQHHWIKIFPEINPNIPDQFYDPEGKFKLKRPEADDVFEKARRLSICCACGALTLKK